MKTRTTVIAILLMLLGVLVLVFANRPTPRHYRLELTGTPGLKVKGHWMADGGVTDFQSTLPATIHAHAKSFSYSIKLQHDQGDVKGALFVDDNLEGYSSTAGDHVGVAGSIRFGLFGHGRFFTTTNKGSPDTMNWDQQP